MPVYVTLFKWTDQGVEDIKSAPAKIEESLKTAKERGGKVLGMYITMGAYDLVSIVEWPSDDAAVTTAMAISSRGNVRTTTMRAFTAPEFAEMAKKLP